MHEFGILSHLFWPQTQARKKSTGVWYRYCTLCTGGRGWGAWRRRHLQRHKPAKVGAGKAAEIRRSVLASSGAALSRTGLLRLLPRFISSVMIVPSGLLYEFWRHDSRPQYKGVVGSAAAQRASGFRRRDGRQVLILICGCLVRAVCGPTLNCAQAAQAPGRGVRCKWGGLRLPLRSGIHSVFLL